jgi:hypothetical protein
MAFYGEHVLPIRVTEEASAEGGDVDMVSPGPRTSPDNSDELACHPITNPAQAAPSSSSYNTPRQCKHKIHQENITTITVIAEKSTKTIIIITITSQNTTKTTMPPKRDVRQELLARFPPSSALLDDRCKVLILVTDHGTVWGDKEHQEFIANFKKHYLVEASDPASCEAFINSKNPDIIFVIGATTMHDSCNREATATRLKEFAQNGGKVIFGGVPYGFNPKNKQQDPTVFKKMFGLDWIVGTTQETFTKRMPDAAKPLMYDRTIKLKATYLKNVPEDAALFYVCENKFGAKPKKNAQCPVAYQAYGEGFMAYVGMEDLTEDITLEMYRALCKGA